MRHLTLLALLIAPTLALSQGSTNDYIFSQKPITGPLVPRPVTPSVGKLLGWPSNINAPAAITLGSGLSLSGSTLSATGSGGTWGSITGTLSAQADLNAALISKQPLNEKLNALSSLTTSGAGVMKYTTDFGFTAGQLIPSDLWNPLGANTIMSFNGSGNGAAITPSAVLDIIGTTRGQILYRGASGWTVASAGTSGQVWTTGGAGADPSWTTVGVSDGDKGSITVSSSGTVWTIDASAVTNSMLAGSISASKITGTAIVGAVGSTDNALVRADGTGGGTAQGSVATITDLGAPTFYDSLTLLKTGSADSSTMEVVSDPLNGGVRALYILPPGHSGRIYFGKTGRTAYSLDFSSVSSVTAFPSIIGVAPYSILTYVGNVSLQAVNGNVVLETTAGGQVSIPAAYVEMAEMTAPSAPAANKARYYFEDNGAGKTRFMVQFPSGAAQQIAIEP